MLFCLRQNMISALTVGAIFSALLMLSVFLGALGGVFLLIVGLPALCAYFAYLRHFTRPKLPVVTEQSDRLEQRRAYEAVKQISLRARMETPTIFLQQKDDQNVSAGGLSANRSFILLDSSMLPVFEQNPRLADVIAAHNLGHISNGDIQVFSILHFFIVVLRLPFGLGTRLLRFLMKAAKVIGVVGGIATLFRLGGRGAGTVALVVMIMFMGVLALSLYVALALLWFAFFFLSFMLIVQAFFRSREYLADAFAAAVVNDREQVVEALLDIVATDTHEQAAFDEFCEKMNLPAGEIPLADLMRALERPGFKFSFIHVARESMRSHPFAVNRMRAVTQRTFALPADVTPILEKA